MAQGPMFIGSNGYTLPPATKNALGGVIVGENLTVSEVGEIDVPVATKNTPGVIKVGDGLELDEEGRLNSNGALSAYPVGSIFETVSHASPASMFGGIWEEIAQGRTLMGATDAQITGTTVEAGLPNITGHAGPDVESGFYNVNRPNAYGAFYGGGKSYDWAAGGKQTPGKDLCFDASRSNPIYGASDTVQPPAYIVHIWERMGYLLNVRSNPGSSLTITDGKTTVEDVVDDSGRYSRELPSTGTWTITVSKDGNVFTETRVVDTYGVYTVDIALEIFGVVWNYGNSSTALTRLTEENDPYGFVNVNITSEPVPAVGASKGTSPFDKYMPWKGMEEYNIVNGTVGAKQGEQGFSRANDTMVFIPEFYYRVIDDASGKKRYFYVASKKASGFEKHPGSGRYVGRYNTASGYVSKTGLAPLESVTRAGMRTKSANKGAGWYLYDYACYCAIGLLYLVEYANFDAMSKIGKGYFYNVSEAFASATGDTDAMIYHTGRADGNDGATSIQYRHIENLYGDHYEFVDGINLNGSAVYVCTNPNQYADNTANSYTNIGTRATSEGYIKTLGYSKNAPWAFYPSAVGGSSTTYTGNYCTYSSGWKVFSCSGNRYPGMFYFGGDSASSSSPSWTTSRLMYVPQ